MKSKSLFINGEWTPGTGPLFASENPSTGEILWEGSSACPSDIAMAVQSAKDAVPQWSSLSTHERYRYLINFTAILKERTKDLAEIISKETGKPLWDSTKEVEAMIQKAAISLDAFEKRCAELTQEMPHTRSITRHRPHGVVAILGPYNFPGHLPNGHLMPALLAGNTVVFKPSELTPLVAEETVRLWEEPGLPKGVLNLIQGGRETGEALIHHPGIQGLFFTGSYRAGQYISQVFASDVSKILALEMGGNNPLIIGEVNDLRVSAQIIILSAFLSAGQRCTCARRLILPESQLGEDLLQELVKSVSSIIIGPYTQRPEPFMGPVISNAHAEALLLAQKELQNKGGKSLALMRKIDPQKPFLTPGLMDVSAIPNQSDEELFGPFLQIVFVKNFEEALHKANQTKFGLSAGLLSVNPDEYSQFLRTIKAGIVNWNAPLTGASSYAPFGGIKCSGNHRPSAYYAADYCSYPVASFENPDLIAPTALPPGLT
jgi:succinylglutamic semialdehyde dehydrogenase